MDILIIDMGGNSGGDRVAKLSPELVAETNGELAAYRINPETGKYQVGNRANEAGDDFEWEDVPVSETVQ